MTDSAGDFFIEPVQARHRNQHFTIHDACLSTSPQRQLQRATIRSSRLKRTKQEAGNHISAQSNVKDSR